MTQTTLMSIPGQSDPVPVARDITPREDGRVDLIGLPKDRIRELFDEAGLDAKQAKLRAKQVFHWLYHRGVTDFDAMPDIAKTMRPWLAERFFIGRPDVVEAQHSTDGTRKWLLRTRNRRKCSRLSGSSRRAGLGADGTGPYRAWPDATCATNARCRLARAGLGFSYGDRREGD